MMAAEKEPEKFLKTKFLMNNMSSSFHYYFGRLAVLLLLTACSGGDDLAQADTLAGSTDLVIGTSLGGLLGDADYMEIAGSQFSGITPENEMKLSSSSSF